MFVIRLTVVGLVVALLTVSACSSDSTKPAAASSASASASAGDGTLHILVSNDDGVGAPGIDALVQALAAEPSTELTVVAPAENQSGAGGRTTQGSLVANTTTTKSGHAATAVQGSPADAVNYGLSNVLTSAPDLVITGVNAGQNLGPFIDVSGTVGAARAAATRGITAIAVSSGFPDPFDFTAAVQITLAWLHQNRDGILRAHGAPTSVVNLNVPTCIAGAVRGLVETAPDLDGPKDVALAPAACTSTAPATSEDVTAFHDGFATISDVSLTPSSGSTSESTGAPTTPTTIRVPPQAGASQ